MPGLPSEFLFKYWGPESERLAGPRTPGQAFTTYRNNYTCTKIQGYLWGSPAPPAVWRWLDTMSGYEGYFGVVTGKGLVWENQGDVCNGVPSSCQIKRKLFTDRGGLSGYAVSREQCLAPTTELEKLFCPPILPSFNAARYVFNGWTTGPQGPYGPKTPLSRLYSPNPDWAGFDNSYLQYPVAGSSNINQSPLELDPADFVSAALCVQT